MSGSTRYGVAAHSSAFGVLAVCALVCCLLAIVLRAVDVVILGLLACSIGAGVASWRALAGKVVTFLSAILLSSMLVTYALRVREKKRLEGEMEVKVEEKLRECGIREEERK